MRSLVAWMSAIAAAAAILSFGAAPAFACPEGDGQQTCNDDPFPIDCSQAGPYYVNFIIRNDATDISSALTFDTPPGPCPGLTRLPDDTNLQPDATGNVSNPDGTKTAVPAGKHVYRISWKFAAGGTGSTTAHASLTYTDPTTTTGGGGTTTTGGGGTTTTGGGGTANDCTPKIAAVKSVARTPTFWQDPDNEYNFDVTAADQDLALGPDGNGPFAIMEGRTFAFKITLTNAGCSGSVDVRDLVPAGFQVLSAGRAVYEPKTYGPTWNDHVPIDAKDFGGATQVSFGTISVPGANTGWNGDQEPTEVVLYITGKATRPGTLINQATVDDKPTNTVNVQVTSASTVGEVHATPSAVSGIAETSQVMRAVASSPLWRIDHVEVAVQRVGGKSGTCTWLVSRAGELKTTKPVAGRCVPGPWLRATGTSRWRLRFTHRLRKGHYLVYARAVNRAGASDNRFKRGRNLVALSVG